MEATPWFRYACLPSHLASCFNYLGAGNQTSCTCQSPHHDGCVLRDGEAPGVIDSGTGSETFNATIDSRAHKSQLLALCNDRLVQWLACKVDAQHSLLKFFFHDL